MTENTRDPGRPDLAEEKTNPSEEPGKNTVAKKAGRVFLREILIPIVLALLVIQFVIQAFKIPSASMEDSLLVGDFLLGLKFIYGAPLPFTEKKLPGLTRPEPGDVIIFRYPGDPLYPQDDKERYGFVANLFLFGNLYWDRKPEPGQKRLVWYMPKDFIKRCVGKSGQTLRFSDKRLFVDDKETPLPRRGKYIAFDLDPKRDQLQYRIPAPGETYRLDTLGIEQASWIRSLAYQENPDKKIEMQLDFYVDGRLANDYRLPSLDGLTPTFYELLKVPYERTTGFRAVQVPVAALAEAARTGFIRQNDLMPEAATAGGRRVEYNEYLLGFWIQELCRRIEEQGRSEGRDYRFKARLRVDGTVQDAYTLKKNCYFMMGDNRDNSHDSRYWGLLSEDFVKAKAFLIYFSFENQDHAFSFVNPFSWFTIPAKIRWTRIGKLIE